jgi:hypothetical protein
MMNLRYFTPAWMFFSALVLDARDVDRGPGPWRV